MPKFAANLSFLFTDAPFPERFRRAAAAGFKGVEYLFPYEHSPQDIAGWLNQNDLEQVLFNLSPGDWAAGERGLACLPHRQGEFAESVDQALDYAIQLDCERLHCMAGIRPAGADEAELEATYIANLRHAADRLATAGVTVMIEPVNSRIDMPGYWLDSIDKGFRLLEAVDRDNVKLQYDIYHAQIMAGDLAALWQRPQLIERQREWPMDQPIHLQPPLAKSVCGMRAIGRFIRIGRAIGVEPVRNLVAAKFRGQPITAPQ